MPLTRSPTRRRLRSNNCSDWPGASRRRSCFKAIRIFLGAVNRPEPALWITLAAPLSTPCWFIYWEARTHSGQALASTLLNCGMSLAGLWFATMRRPFCDYHVLALLWRFDWSLMRYLIVIGASISIVALIGCGVFSAAAFLAGLISTRALAAHQIALHVAAILIMISLGIGTAASVRVGHVPGRNDGPGIKRAGLVAMLLGIVIAAVLTLAVIAARFEIAELLLSKSAGDADAIIGRAATLLLVGATFLSSMPRR